MDPKYQRSWADDSESPRAIHGGGHYVAASSFHSESNRYPYTNGHHYSNGNSSHAPIYGTGHRDQDGDGYPSQGRYANGNQQSRIYTTPYEGFEEDWARTSLQPSNPHPSSSHQNYSAPEQGSSTRGRSDDRRHDYDRRDDNRDTRRRDTRRDDRIDDRRERIDRNSQRRGAPSYLDISNQRELGIVCSLKDSYGFIKCADRDDDLFFHFTELSRSEPAVGLEVEFNVATDSKNGKLSAIQLVVLSKGSVAFEDIDPTHRVGMLIKEANMDGEPGEVEYAPDDSDARETLRFSLRDLAEPKVPLCAGDEVKFNLVINKRTKTRTATNVVIYRFGGKRETGVIQSLKDNFGFIKCSEQPVSVYFHFRDVVLLQKDQRDLGMGMEVEFTIENDSKVNKPFATRVRGLPRGTVSFTIVLPERLTGVVSKEFALSNSYSSFNHSNRRVSDEDMGQIDCVSTSGVEKFLFNGKDLENFKQPLRLGDQVEFSVLIKKRSGKKKATNIILLKAAPEVFEYGIVCSIHKNYGHLTCMQRDEDMFFHFSDLEINNEDIGVGSELEFVVVTDSRSNKKKAIHIKHAPSGSVIFETVLPERYRGIVIRECKPGVAQPPAHISVKKRDEHGTVEFIDAQGNSFVLTFASYDLKNKKAQIWPGDEIEFNLSVESKTGIRGATSIELVKPKELLREQGVVTAVKNYFGFLSTPTRVDEVYFHFTELELVMDKNEITQVKPGFEVEFSVATDSWANNKPIAINFKILPKGTVKFEDTLPGRHPGIVDRELRGRGHHSETYGGKITFQSPDTKAMESLPFDAEDVDKRFSLKRGDRVEFSIATNRRNKEKKASNIVLMRETGVVEGIKQSYGFIHCDEKGHEDKLFFHEREVEEGTILQEGDIVEFLRVYSSRNKDYNAIEIKKIKDAAIRESPKKPHLNINKVDSKVFILRQPKSAGWTQSFAPGRGKLLNEEVDKLTQSMLNSFGLNTNE